MASECTCCNVSHPSFALNYRAHLFLQFCRKCASNKQTSKTLTKALQLHPKVPGLWAYAAAWEFESNKNPQV